MASRPTLLVVVGSRLAGLPAAFAETGRVEVVTADDPGAVIDEADAVDCLVVSQQLPGTSGLALLDRIRETSPALPMVLLAADGSEELASDAFAAGVSDYLPVEADDPAVVDIVARVVDTVTDARATTHDREQHETIVETVPAGVFVFDDAARIVGGNQRGAEMLGYEDKSDLLGVEIPELVAEGVFHEEVIEQYLDVLPDLLSAETESDTATVEFRAFPDSDDERTFEASIALRPSGDGYRGAIGIIRDVTERRKRREELEQYETIINAVPDPVYALDENGLFTFINEAMESMMGYDYDDAQEKGVYVGITQADLEQSRELIRELLASDTPTETVTFDMTTVTRDGRSIDVENHMALLPHDEEFQGTAGILRDVSEQRRRKRRLDVLDTILRHNLRNDMNVITGYAELLSEEVTDPDLAAAADSIRSKAADLIEIGNEVRVLQNVIDTWERGDSQSVVDAAPLLERVVERFERAHPEATIDVDCPDSLWVVGGSSLQRALTDLVENAIVHNESDEPAVEIRVEMGCDPPETAASEARRGDWVAIHVADDGPGIPPEERQLVTDDEDITPLQHGSGLGLWAVSWITDAFGGDVEIDDRQPRGTVVTLRLQRVPEKA